MNEPRSPRDRDALRSVHSAADKRLAFVQEWLRAKERHGKVNMAELCRRHCISRKTGYKWIERWDPNDPQSLHDRSRIPHEQPRRTSDSIIQLIVAAREENPGWGPRRLRAQLIEQHPDLQFPAESTFGQILRREGLIGHGGEPEGRPPDVHANDQRDTDMHRAPASAPLDLRGVSDLVIGHADSVTYARYEDARRDYIEARLARVLEDDPALRHILTQLAPWARAHALAYPAVLEAILAWELDTQCVALELRRFVEGVEQGAITPPQVAGSSPDSPGRGLSYVTDASIAKKPELQPVSEAARGPACQHLCDAMALIRSVSPYTAELVTRFVDLCCLVEDPRTLRCSSGSFNRIVGLIFIRNAHLGSPLHVADGLIHEAVHELLFSYELAHHPLFPAQRPPFIRSPWSGNVLPPDAYVQACVVWFALAHFWQHALHRGVAEAETYLDRAQRGFLQQPITRPLLEGHADAAPENTMMLLADIEGRMAAGDDHAPAQRLRPRAPRVTRWADPSVPAPSGPRRAATRVGDAS